MKKIIAALLIMMTVFTAAFAMGGSEKQELIIYTWADMFPQEVLDDFTKETGIEVIYSNFDTNENMLEKISMNGGSEYDIIITDDYMLDILRQQDLIQKLDKSKIPNFRNINSFYQGYFFDPDDEYVVPYGAGIPLIVYDPEKVDFEIKGYKDLWNPSLKESIALVANYRVVNSLPLLAAGHSLNCDDLDTIKEAGERLLELAPNVRLIQDASTEVALLNGEASVAFLYTSQVTNALNMNPGLIDVFPEESIGFGIMGAVIPKNAPDADNAHRFLDYLLRDEVSAACFNHIGYYSTTKTADPLVSPNLIIPDGMTGEIMQAVSDQSNEQYIQNFMKFQDAIN